jgi:hypothetical protein
VHGNAGAGMLRVRSHTGRYNNSDGNNTRTKAKAPAIRTGVFFVASPERWTFLRCRGKASASDDLPRLTTPLPRSRPHSSALNSRWPAALPRRGGWSTPKPRLPCAAADSTAVGRLCFPRPWPPSPRPFQRARSQGASAVVGPPGTPLARACADRQRSSPDDDPPRRRERWASPSTLVR